MDSLSEGHIVMEMYQQGRSSDASSSGIDFQTSGESSPELIPDTPEMKKHTIPKFRANVERTTLFERKEIDTSVVSKTDDEAEFSSPEFIHPTPHDSNICDWAPIPYRGTLTNGGAKMKKSAFSRRNDNCKESVSETDDEDDSSACEILDDSDDIIPESDDLDSDGSVHNTDEDLNSTATPKSPEVNAKANEAIEEYTSFTSKRSLSISSFATPVRKTDNESYSGSELPLTSSSNRNLSSSTPVPSPDFHPRKCLQDVEEQESFASNGYAAATSSWRNSPSPESPEACAVEEYTSYSSGGSPATSATDQIMSPFITVLESPSSPPSPTLKELQRKLEKKKSKLACIDLSSQVDGGSKLRKKISQLEHEIARRKSSLSEMYKFNASVIEIEEEEKVLTPPATVNESELETKMQQLDELKTIYRAANPRCLPDGGDRLKKRISKLEMEVMMLELKSDINRKTSPPEVIKVETSPVEVIQGPSVKYQQSKLTSFGYLNQLPKSKSKEDPPQKSAFDLVALYEVSVDYGARNYGGVVSLSREREMVRVTGNAVEVLHEVLKDAPDTNVVEEEDPKGLCVPLMSHQRRALAWLLWRETQLPRGGILADDMGLGKTLTMISLVMKHREYVKSGTIKEDFEFVQNSSDEDEVEEEQIKLGKKNQADTYKKTLVPSKGTLVVCPATLLGQWVGEVEKRIYREYRLKIFNYHGNSRNIDIHSLAHYDMVITTYTIVQKQAFSSGKEKKQKGKDDVPKMKAADQGPLFQIGWGRVILDEAHQIRNHKTKTAQAACLLRCGRRWALSGTPVQNKDMDMYSLIRFLRVKPFDNYTYWKLQVSNNSVQGMHRLGLIVKTLMLRRTKDQVDPQTGEKIVELPEKKIIQHTLSLSQKEREVYDRIFTFSKSAMTQYMKTQEEKELEKLEKFGNNSGFPIKNPVVVSDNKYTPTLSSELPVMNDVKVHHLMVLLLRLRQLCSHPSLIIGMVDTENIEVDGINADNQEGLELDLVDQMAEMSLREPKDVAEEADAEVQKDILTMKNPVFQKSATSSKITRIIEELLNIRRLGRKEKSVIVSQWTSMLDVVELHLKEEGIRCLTISGQVAVKDRQCIVDNFNNNPNGPKVLLLSLLAGGVGLNLVGGNHLFFLDMHWNPQLEAQACDRIYRLGQQKPVTIHRFVVNNTVEEKIFMLQLKKLRLANDILSGAQRVANSKLTLDDMKMIFNVGHKDDPKL